MQTIAGKGPSPVLGRARSSWRCCSSGFENSMARSKITLSGTTRSAAWPRRIVQARTQTKNGAGQDEGVIRIALHHGASRRISPAENHRESSKRLRGEQASVDTGLVRETLLSVNFSPM